MHYSVKLVDTRELKTKVIAEVITKITAEIAIEIAIEVTTEVLIKLTTGRLGYYLQIWLIIIIIHCLTSNLDPCWAHTDYSLYTYREKTLFKKTP